MGPAPATESNQSILERALSDALAGGLPGMAAMMIQVICLMWLRTTVNYQYRYGTSMITALRTLYSQGGIPRFYAGLSAAVFQAPLSRFGDTAANAFVMSIFESRPDLPVPTWMRTACGSSMAALWRVCIMPIDAVKSSLQVDGSRKGWQTLKSKVVTQGPIVLWRGSSAACLATFVGHYPWFFTHNTLNEYLPKTNDFYLRLLRAGFMGFCSAAVSDTVANSVRVVKTVRQTSPTPLTYRQVIQQVVKEDGLSGLFLRGLGTKIVSNGVQGIVFSIAWRIGQDWYDKRLRSGHVSSP